MAFVPSDMQVTSSAFANLESIPQRHTSEGEDVSPALRWEKAPSEAKSFAVICHDPDAPLVKNGTYGFVHWLLYDLPGDTVELEESTSLGTAGVNDMDGNGFNGPAPPQGHGRHHYYFWVLALDKTLNLEPGLTLGGFLQKAEPHLLGMSRLIGIYQRD